MGRISLILGVEIPTHFSSSAQTGETDSLSGGQKLHSQWVS